MHLVHAGMEVYNYICVQLTLFNISLWLNQAKKMYKDKKFSQTEFQLLSYSVIITKPATDAERKPSSFVDIPIMKINPRRLSISSPIQSTWNFTSITMILYQSKLICTSLQSFSFFVTLQHVTILLLLSAPPTIPA